MKFLIIVFLLGTCSLAGMAQQPPKGRTPPGGPEPSVRWSALQVPAGGGTANAAQAPVASRRADSPQAQNPEVQKIAPPSPPSPPATSAAGFVEPPQLKILLHKIWLAEYRINDLLTQVRPERWKILEVGRNSFNQTLENLRKGLAAQEDWRAQFEKRPESMYLGYETYIAIGAVLPRLEAVAHSVSQYENPSFGVQYSQAGNQLFDLQQALQPFLEFLLRAQDQLLLGSQSNLASCQNELGFAMHARAESAKPMKNILPLFKGRRATHRAAGAVSAKPATGSAKQAVRKTESKTEAKPASKSKPAQKK